MDHLRYSGLPFEAQQETFFAIVSAEPLVREALARARSLNLPDWLVVSGVLYNSVWNHLTGKPSGYGIKDVDLFYFDDGDLSYEAEDAIIRRAAQHFDGLALPVEVRNQARVHLWYPQKFGRSCPRYTSASEPISHFALPRRRMRSGCGSMLTGSSSWWRRLGWMTCFRFGLRRTG